MDAHARPSPAWHPVGVSRRHATIAACLLLTGLAGCGGGQSAPPPSTAPATATRAQTTTKTRPAVAVRTAAPRRRPAPRPGPSLVALGLAAGNQPQTAQLPSSHDARFDALMRALFDAVRQNSVAAGMGAFFPETAYAQIKALADPAADFNGRLVVDFGLDLGAAHALLGADAGQARLVEVRVPDAYAHWVPPGVCLNRFGYYEVPNARVVYQAGGELRSFGIASMISWRGVWYVVHLGAVLRPGAGGVVDAPSSGPGVSEPSSTC